MRALAQNKLEEACYIRFLWCKIRCNFAGHAVCTETWCLRIICVDFFSKLGGVPPFPFSSISPSPFPFHLFFFSFHPPFPATHRYPLPILLPLP